MNAEIAATTAGPGDAPSGFQGGTASRGAQYSWGLFDWANQPVFTVITTFIFAPYFTGVLAGDPTTGQAIWGYLQAFAGLAVALASPILGAMADRSGPRKPFIFVFQAVTVIGLAALWWAVPGSSGALWLAIVALTVTTIGAELSIVFNNALLPTLVPPSRIGRLSGLGWGMGYIGGLIALFAVLIVSRPELLGIAVPDGEALFGLSLASHAVERLTGPASALWLILFVLPMFLFTPDVPRTGSSGRDAAAAGLGQLRQTFTKLRGYRNETLFLLAFFIYNNGVTAVIAFGGVYFAATFGWGTTELGIFGIIVTIFAAIGCFVGGALDDRIGSKGTVTMALIGMAIATVGILSLTANAVLFFVDTVPVAADGPLFGSLQEQVGLLFAVLIGICLGPAQSASRSMIGRLAPPQMLGEFYGLFALSGRASAIFAPLLIGLVTQVTDSRRLGIAVVLIFLFVGIALLLRVHEPRAGRTPARPA